MLTKSFRARRKIRVGEVLLQRGLITQSQLNQALAKQKQNSAPLGEILVQQGWVSYAQLKQALNEQYWRNIAATALISLSTLIPSATRWAASPVVASIPQKVAHADSIVPHAESHESHGSHETSLMSHVDVGGADQHEGHAQSEQTFICIALTQQPLQENPTVASPLQGFCHPLQGKGWLSQGIRGTTHQGRMEYAYDLAADIGTPVYAMRPGRVIAVRDKYPDTGGGKDRIAMFNYVWLEHEGGYRSAYIHLQQGFVSTSNIKAGDWVTAGQLIGYTGNSGWSTGPHLHLEVQQPGRSGTFTKTAPFAIAGTCDTGQVARR
ncbi:MAG: peptidoglycan DD-metalloendopeptidase family protein [Thermosynechococcaceae cyanobacterium]